MTDNAALLGMQQQQQQPDTPSTNSAQPPSHVDNPQRPLRGSPAVMPQPTPPETTPHPGF